MNGDIIIFIAFCIFVFLLGIRIKQRLSEQRDKKTKDNDTGYTPAISEKQNRRERILAIIQLCVFGGLAIYMIPILIRDFTMEGQTESLEIFLRCLIFIFTIYIFILAWIKVLRPKNKENTGE